LLEVGKFAKKPYFSQFYRRSKRAAPIVFPEQAPLSRSRLRNQADFYSLFGAIAECLQAHDPVLQQPKATLANRLDTFLQIIEDDELRAQSEPATRYLNAARSNSNDVGQRKNRIEIIAAVLRG
jgi:hypothetical protein